MNPMICLQIDHHGYHDAHSPKLQISMIAMISLQIDRLRYHDAPAKLPIPMIPVISLQIYRLFDFRDDAGIIFNRFWDYFGVTLESFWDNVAVMLGTTPSQLRMICRLFWGSLPATDRPHSNEKRGNSG